MDLSPRGLIDQARSPTGQKFLKYSAVSVVSGHITGQTDTMPLRVEKLYNDYQGAAAFGVASLLALLALLTLGIKTLLEWRQARAYELAQRAVEELS